MKKKVVIVAVGVLIILAIGVALFLMPINIIKGDLSNVHIVYAGIGYSTQVSTDYDGVDSDAQAITTTLKNGSIKRTFSRSYRNIPDSRILLEYNDGTGHHSLWIYLEGDAVMIETNSFVGHFSGDTELLINQIKTIVNYH